MALNSAHIAAWSCTNATSGASGGTVIGAGDGTNYSRIIPKYVDGKSYLTINDLAAASGQTSPGSDGHLVLRRYDSSNLIFYRNATSAATISPASTALPNSTIFILAQNISGTATTGGGLRVAVSHGGADLSATQVTNLYNRLRTYLTAIGSAC